MPRIEAASIEEHVKAQTARILAAATELFRTGPGLVPYDFSRPGLFERQDDWSSCAYFYLDRPENNLPALAPVADRIAGLLPEQSPEKK